MQHTLSTSSGASRDELPPHSTEAEQGVLGCIFLSAAETIPECAKSLRGGLDCFYDLRHRVIYELVLEMHDKKEAIDVITVQQRLKDKHQLEAVGGVAYLASLPDFVPSAANLSFYVSIVREKYTQRRTLQACSEVADAIMGRPDLAGSTIAGWKRAAEYLATELDCDDDKRVLDLVDAREFNPDVRPKDAPAMFTMTCVDICTPGNLTAITSGVKTGKTAFIDAMVAAIMGDDTRDTLGVKSSNPAGLAVLRYDTEQSEFDHWMGGDRALRRAGVMRPPWFHSYYVAGISVRDLVAALTANLKRMAKAHGGIHSVFLDGVADFATDINDPAESNGLVAQLHGLAIQYHCPIICVIHFNPGGEKTRGHLGSQLERKAETNLTLRKTGDVTVVFSTKQRRAPIPEATGPRFKWSEEHRMHVSCSADENPAAQGKVETFRCELEDIYRDRHAMGYSDLKATVMKCLTVGDRTAERKIKAYRQHGLITKGAANLFVFKG